MSDLLAIALSGVKAYSKALEVVGDNVANASTPGHVRRTATFMALEPGGGAPAETGRAGGNGVVLTGINRAIDLLRTDSLRRSESDVAALDSADRWITAIQNSLTGASALDDPITVLFGAVSDLAADPANLAVRAAFLETARTVADRFNEGAAELDAIGADILAEAQTEVDTLNSFAQGLAEVNNRLRRAPEGSASAAALADQRDILLAKIATITSFDVRFDARGQAMVRLPDAGGPLLVKDDKAFDARLEAAAGGGFRLRIGPPHAGESASLISGSLAGLVVAARKLDEIHTHHDAFAGRIAQEFNAAHMAGVDRNGAPGQPLFRTQIAEATPAAANGGNARIRATLADGAPAGEQILLFDGATWTLSRADGSAADSGDLPLTLDGVTVDGPGVARNGDVFHIGIRGGAMAMGLRDVSPAEVAAAPGFLSEGSGANTGDARASLAPAPARIPAATGPFQVTADHSGLFELRDSTGLFLASGAAGDWLEGDGFAIQLVGRAQAGDSFTIRATGADSSANDNALALLALRDGNGAAGTWAEVQDSMLTQVSVPLAVSRARRDIAIAARDTAAEALNAASGVDLNTEAAEMLRLQQAYQANARIIQTARETFDAILAAGR